MIKIDIPVQKRYKPTVFDQFIQEKMSKTQKNQIQCLQDKNAQKFILKDIQNKENWNKKQEQNLIVLLLQKITEEPYLEFCWEFFEQFCYMTKICKKLRRSQKSCIVKLGQIKSVHEQNYINLGIVDFLLVFWKGKNFKSREGREHVKKIKQLKETQSDHMKMCDQVILNLSDQENSFMNLYNLIMKN